MSTPLSHAQLIAAGLMREFYGVTLTPTDNSALPIGRWPAYDPLAPNTSTQGARATTVIIRAVSNPVWLMLDKPGLPADPAGRLAPDVDYVFPLAPQVNTLFFMAPSLTTVHVRWVVT